MSNRITVRQFCAYYGTEPEFFDELQQHGLMDFTSADTELLIEEEQLPDLERLRYWRYELAINVEGIDVIQNLLIRQKELKLELDRLRRELSLFSRT